jgi:UDP-2,3-diacylglucosamine pyrophosphatase LpxH
MVKIIVISDLHASCGPLDDFDSDMEEQLCHFLVDLCGPGMAVELVINGDFLDFVQAEPWEGDELSSTSAVGGFDLCFTEEQSLAKLENIHKAHKKMFHALGKFLAASAGNRLVILPGNHDPDFFFDRVCERFRELVGERTRVVFYRTLPYYRPDNAPNVLIEHGHQYDMCNNFFVTGQPRWTDEHPPILPGRDGTPRLLQCPGTRFLLRYLNRLDRDYHYVDNVKPFGRFLSIFGRSAFVPGYGPMLATVAVWDMMRFVAAHLKEKPSVLLGIKDGQEADSQAVLRARLGAMTDRAALVIQDHFVERGFDEFLAKQGLALKMHIKTFVDVPRNAEAMLDFLVENPDLVAAFSRKGADLGFGGGGTLTLGKGFFFKETDVLIDAGKERLRRDPTIDTVIMGHTHEAVGPDDLRSGGVHYFNTGCWTRYYRFGEKESVRSWELLQNPDYALFPYELNYVQIIPGRPAVAEWHNFSSRFGHA